MGFTMKRISATLALATALASTIGGSALAQSAGDWTLGVGIGYLKPKSDSGTIAGGSGSIDSDVRPIFTAEYFVWDNVGIELLAATPFKHDISVNGGYAATTKHLPPTLSLNYHFDTGSKWKPYAGVGINYTKFFDESTPLGTISLDDSWGVAVQAGLDYQISDQGSVRLNVRWFDIDTDVTLNGSAAGTAEIDPILVGVSYVHKF
jgi:outer membrane protein